MFMFQRETTQKVSEHIFIFTLKNLSQEFLYLFIRTFNFFSKMNKI